MKPPAYRRSWVELSCRSMIGWRLGTTAWVLRLLDACHISPRSYRENQSLLYRRQVQVKDSNTW
jgi:hypothetical protein